MPLHSGVTPLAQSNQNVGLANGRLFAPSTMLIGLVAFLALGAVLLTEGPHLADHEVIVAQTARQIVDSNHWLVPHYLDTPFLVKPPLPAWTVAILSEFFPTDSMTGHAVTDVTARLPSFAATVLTILIVRRLARRMFDTRTADIAAFVTATSFGMLLFSVNATAEAMLTLLCTWAFAEFWYSQTAESPREGRSHLVRFYIALGLAMLAKGPMPMAMVCLPIAFWWWAQRSIRLVAAGGPATVGPAVMKGIREFGSRFLMSLRRHGLWWGIPLFLLMFLPWMIFVAGREPYAWRLWDYEFLDRARGNYPGCKWGKLHYYFPILFGMLLPWCLSLPEAIAAPFLRKYSGHRRPLTYAWCWVVVPFLFATMMSFKKPYYILPIVPGCSLLLAVVLERLFFRTEKFNARLMWCILAAILSIISSIPIVGWFLLPKMYPEEWHGPAPLQGIVICIAILIGLSLSATWFVRGLRRRSLVGIGLTSLVAFAVTWCLMGPQLSNIDDPLALVKKLQAAGIDEATPLYWASNRPDGRVTFYGGRELRQVVDPYRLIAEHRDRVDGDDLRMMVAARILDLLKGSTSVYMVMQREDYQLLMSIMRPPSRILFSLDRGEIGEDGEDWLVITNESLDQLPSSVQ